jgi:hypothetical protein
LVFILIIFVSLKLGNIAPRDYEAVGGFFDAPHEGAHNTSFEGGNKSGATTQGR